jgi:hypothetical protein
MPVIALEDFVRDFAEAVRAVDAPSPVAVNVRSKSAYQPGLGPHTEAYALYFHEVPRGLLTAGCVRPDGLTLLDLEIAPKPSRRFETRSLRRCGGRWR